MSRPASPDGWTNVATWKSSFLYEAGLIVVACALILLPAIYLALIGLAGYGVYWHATENTGILTAGHFHGGRAAVVRFLIYAAPIAAGGILIFFLLKPFLAREGSRPESFTLAPSSEPLLFAFIQKICALIGAPMPKRVQVNCEVNASASFRRGIWSMFGNDLTLTIGLPLAAGLSAREFAGVLAHEFGHFAQGTAMRVSYIINSVNRWFARVVYERDAWDEWLVEQSEGSDIRTGVILYVARFGVWVSRKVLWCLMMAGHALSCFMSRQMEYDADSYEIKLAGSDGFASTMRRFQVLSFAHAESGSELAASWKTGRLPENLPRFLSHKARALPEEVQRKVVEASAESRTTLFHTHPADSERVRRAERVAAAGVFRMEEPASWLFKDFDELCKSLTLFHYQQDLELRLTPQNLVPMEETLTEADADIEGAKAVERYFLGGTTDLRPVLFTEFDMRPLRDPNQSLTALLEARQRMETKCGQARDALKAWMEADRKAILGYQADQLLLVGFKIRPEEFQLAEATHQAAARAQADAGQEQKQAGSDLEAFETEAKARLVSALQLLPVPEMLASFENGDELVQETSRLVRTFDALRSVIPPLLELRKEQVALQILIAKRADFSDVQRVDFRISKVTQAIHKIIPDLQLKLARVPFPFKHTKGNLSVADYARYEPADGHPVINAVQQAGSHLDRLPALYSRMLGRLVRIAEEVEARLVASEGESAAPSETDRPA